MLRLVDGLVLGGHRVQDGSALAGERPAQVGEHLGVLDDVVVVQLLGEAGPVDRQPGRADAAVGLDDRLVRQGRHSG